MRLLGNTVLLTPLDESTSSGGIQLVERYRDKKQYRVVAVGPGKKLKNGAQVAPDVKPGDKVLYDLPMSGTRHSLPDGTILVDADLIQMTWL